MWDVCNCVLWIENCELQALVRTLIALFSFSFFLAYISPGKMRKHHLMLCDWRLILEAMLFFSFTHAPYIYVNCSKHSSGIHGRDITFFSLLTFCAIQLFVILFSYWCCCCCFLPNRRVQLEKCAFISSIYGVRCVYNSFTVCLCVLIWLESSVFID